MKWTKKQLCMLLAAVVSVCFAVCLIATVRIVLTAQAVPSGMGMLTLITALCTFMIWRGVREME